ncbi:hypothetical protein FRC02_008083 [Tulasnella sp. 418]|nr:hypothetical protein FRC02_008083 [Tulasnella sp. 418]
MCIRPLNDICKRNQRDTPPYVKVSVRPNYENTLEKLAQLTKETVMAQLDTRQSTTSEQDETNQSGKTLGNRVDADQPTTSRKNESRQSVNGTVWITWAMAQRVDPNLSLDASIEIGKKEFWKYLGSSSNFENRTLATCLDTLHDDIILVWNFFDPEKRLTSDDFKKRMRASISDLFGDKDSGTTLGISAAPPMPRGADVIASLQTVEPLTKWTHNIYDKTPGVLRCLMAYIVNLTLVMQQLFSETRPSGKTPSLSVEVLHRVLKRFQDSTANRQVHEEIRSFVKPGYDIGTTDKVLDEMLRLITEYRGKPEKEAN